MKKAKPRTPRADVVDTLTLSELTVFCDTNADLVIRLVEYGVVIPITPISKTAAEWAFAPVHIARARKAARLMRDLELNVAGVALVLDLIDERDALARRLALTEA